jgi:HYR domain
MIAALVSAFPASAAGTLDQSQSSDSAGTECLCEPFTRLAQTFTAGRTGDLDRIDLLLYRVGSPGDLTVQVRTASGGVPSEVVLATASVAAASVPDAGWVSVPLSSPISSTAGRQYAIVLSAPGASSASPFYGWGSALGDPYAGGDALTSVDSGGSWNPLIGPGDLRLDRAFNTYVGVPDVAPPTITAPTSVLADATSPVGAEVAYSVTASDDIDPIPSVACNPSSGSVFPIGDALVSCTATDAAGNTARATFVVQVNGAAEQLADLQAAVSGAGSGSSFADKVADASAALASGNPGEACEILVALGNQVSAQKGKSITEQQATELLEAIVHIRAVLGC